MTGDPTATSDPSDEANGDGLDTSDPNDTYNPTPTTGVALSSNTR
jgi:hypothetical protein